MAFRISKSTKKFMPKKASSFWMDEGLFDYNYDKAVAGKDYVKLAGYQRAISNFVKILTGKNIPVQYADKGNSYTDGNTVVISSRIDDKDFDPIVGLALHEGSHILLSDFQFLQSLYSKISARATAEDRKFMGDSANGERWYLNYYMMPKLKDIINVIEDRRIDMYVYKNAPGYQLYYKALYNKYFNSPVIDKALKSTSYRKEDWESYMFRIINLTNPNRDLQALKFLKPIFEMIDLNNIGRLQSTEDVFELSYQIYWIIEKACTAENVESVSMSSSIPPVAKQSDKGSGSNGTPTPTPKSSLEDAINELVKDMTKSEEDVEEENMESTGSSSDDEYSGEEMYGDSDSGVIRAEDTTEGEYDLSPKDLNKLRKDKEAQEDFVRGDVKKSKLSNTDSRLVKAVSESDSSVEDAKVDEVDHYTGETVGTVRNVKVLVVKNVTPFVIGSGAYTDLFYSDNDYWSKRHIDNNLSHIQAGLVLGAKLGKKMKIRNEERDTKFTRLKSGVIDKRLIASLGFGAEAVFHKMEQFRYKPMYFHLSIDASGSMSGEKYNECLRLAAAIAKAANMVGNIHVVIDIRSTQGKNPVVAFLYDSERDPLSKLIYNLSHSHASGTTPEGLCFDVIMKDIIKGSQSKDAIFFNFSDGEPVFESEGARYEGPTALAHTRKQVSRMNKSNIQVISYFISPYGEGSRAYTNFKTMYGKDARYINTNNIIELSKTINERMMKVC
jgi:hypothetical protein